MLRGYLFHLNVHVDPIRDGGTLNYEKPKLLAGRDFYSSYKEYNVHMMGDGITLFFTSLVLKKGHVVTGIKISISA